MHIKFYGCIILVVVWYFVRLNIHAFSDSDQIIQPNNNKRQPKGTIYPSTR
jgi:hypothetical protein